MDEAMIELRCYEGPLFKVGVSAFDFLWLAPIVAPTFIIRFSRIGVPEFLGANGE